MAPEILDNLPYDNSVDVYSFGVVMHFILSGGQLPQIKLSEMAKGKKPAISSEINKFSKEIIEICMSFSPIDRPTFSDISQLILDNNFQLITGVNSSEVREFVHKTIEFG